MLQSTWNVDCDVWRVYFKPKKWYKLFLKGREYIRPGRPSTSTTIENVLTLMKIVLNNRRMPIREFAEVVSLLVGSTYAIFSDVLGMKRVPAKFFSEITKFRPKVPSHEYL